MSVKKWHGLTIALGLAGGVAAAAAHAPLAWMLGPMGAVTIAALAGAPTRTPARLRLAMLATLGVALGSAARPELLDRVASWSLSLLLLPIYLLLIGGACWMLLERRAKFDRVTAYFSAMPGGLSEMVLMGASLGGDGRRLAAVQAARILFVLFLVPLIFSAAGHAVPPRASLFAMIIAPWPGAADLALLVLIGAVGFWGGRLARLPASALLGPMLLSVAAHIGGLTAAAPPPLWVAAAQVVVGSSLGARFAGGRPLETLRMMGLGALLALVMTFSAVALAALWLPAGGIDAAAAVLLALAPGGLVEMSLIALAFSIDPAFIVAHHLTRIALVVGLAPLLFRIASRASAPKSDAPRPNAPGPDE